MESKKYTLYKLLSEYEVRIPIVQRDYAHGRESKESVRKHLINDIFDVLENDRQLDFNHIYGNDEAGVFFPVDGQQRLTSLYLLHWFLECKGEVVDKRITDCKPFTYMTRNSARAFFRMLKEKQKEIVGCVKNCNNAGDFIRVIQNLPRFSSNWSKDPTVQGALQFLADLVARSITLEKARKYYRMLIEDAAISFVLMTEESDNSEIVVANKYIRMNARGKKLTEFEKLKAVIDGIETKYVNEQGLDPVDLIGSYEREYSNMFFKQTQKEAELKDSDFIAKTSWIDRKSFLLFYSIYNIFVRIILNHPEEIDAVYNENKEENDRKKIYREKIYSISRERNKEDYDYLVLLKAVMEYQREKGIIGFLLNKSEEKFNWLERMVVVYIYYYYRTHKKFDNINLSRLCFVLENLSISSTAQYFMNGGACKLAELLATKEDIWDALSATTEWDIGACFTEKAPDIKGRIHELYLMNAVIRDVNNDLDEAFFKEYYATIWQRKLQAFFYMAGYWIDISQGKPDELKAYLALSKDILKPENNLQWRICYAVSQIHELTGCTNYLFGTMASNACVEQVIGWNSSDYFWSDYDDETKAFTDKIVRLKNAYDLVRRIYAVLSQNKKTETTLDNVIGFLREKLRDWDNWLYYLVNKEYRPDILLNEKLFYDGTTVVLEKKESRKSVVLYAWMLMFAEKMKREHGFWYETLRNQINLDITVTQRQIKLMFYQPELLVKAEKMVTFEGQKKYQLTTREAGTNKTYNMRLVYEKKIPYEKKTLDSNSYYSFAYNSVADKLRIFSYHAGQLMIHELEVRDCAKERQWVAEIKQLFEEQISLQQNAENCFKVKDYQYADVEENGKMYRLFFIQNNRERRLYDIQIMTP